MRAADVRSILAAGSTAPNPRPAGQALVLDLPTLTPRSLNDYAITAANPDPDYTVGLLTYRHLASNHFYVADIVRERWRAVSADRLIASAGWWQVMQARPLVPSTSKNG